MQPAGIVLYAEDPGAANCFAPLARALRDAGVPSSLFASGLALGALRDRGLEPAELAGAASLLGAWSRTRPEWLVVGTSENLDSPAFALTAAAREAGIPSAGLIDSGANAAHRFRGRSAEALHHAPDWLLVPDPLTAREFVRLGHRPDRVVEVGHPGDDDVRAERAKLERIGRAAIRARVTPAAGGRFVLVFVSEIATGLDPGQYRKSPDYTLAGRGTSIGRTEIVVEEVLDAVAALEQDGVPRPWCVLRRHPKETAQDLAALVPGFDQVSAGGSPRELLFAADLVVGLTGRPLAEAYLLGVPAVAIVPRDLERAWVPGVPAGVIECVTGRAAIRRVLRRQLGAQGERPMPGLPAGPRSVDRIFDVLGLRAAASCRAPEMI